MGTTSEHDPSIGSSSGAPSVEILKIKLECIVHLDAQFIEWKVVGIKGNPPRMVALLEAGERALGDPADHAAQMSTAVRSLLEEYCEPFGR